MSAKGDLVLALLVQGLSVKEAAAELGITRYAAYRRLEFARSFQGRRYATTRELVGALRDVESFRGRMSRKEMVG